MPFDTTTTNSRVEVEDMPDVSLHELVGSVGVKTMRVIVMLKGKVVSLLSIMALPII